MRRTIRMRGQLILQLGQLQNIIGHVTGLGLADTGAHRAESGRSNIGRLKFAGVYGFDISFIDNCYKMYINNV